MKTLILTTLFLTLNLAHAGPGPSRWNVSSRILIRYINWYKGDDDLQSKCVILENGAGMISFGEVEAEKVTMFKVSPANISRMKAELAKQAYCQLPKTVDASIGDDHEEAMMSGYYTKTDGCTAYESQYRKVPETSDLSKMVKAACRMEEKVIR